jgi:hypothetical protein
MCVISQRTATLIKTNEKDTNKCKHNLITEETVQVQYMLKWRGKILELNWIQAELFPITVILHFSSSSTLSLLSPFFSLPVRCQAITYLSVIFHDLNHLIWLHLTELLICKKNLGYASAPLCRWRKWGSERPGNVPRSHSW